MLKDQIHMYRDRYTCTLFCLKFNGCKMFISFILCFRTHSFLSVFESFLKNLKLAYTLKYVINILGSLIVSKHFFFSKCIHLKLPILEDKGNNVTCKHQQNVRSHIYFLKRRNIYMQHFKIRLAFLKK